MKIFNAMKTPTLNIVCAEHIESTTNRAMVQASAQSGDIVRVFSEGLAHEECWGILRECIFGGRNEWTYDILEPADLHDALCARLQRADESAYAESLFMPILTSTPR